VSARDDEEQIPIASWVDAAVAATAVRRFAERCGCGPRVAIELAIVARELATNIARHAGIGVIHVRATPDAIEIEAVDFGPGRPDIIDPSVPRPAPSYVDDDGRAREGLGEGLAAVRRLTDSLEASRVPDQGLSVRARRRR
jgi:anti-sigma regulatory factor (Ser/Thr protein kinase)